jgi:hypothetical protein
MQLMLHMFAELFDLWNCFYSGSFALLKVQFVTDGMPLSHPIGRYLTDLCGRTTFRRSSAPIPPP